MLHRFEDLWTIPVRRTTKLSKSQTSSWRLQDRNANQSDYGKDLINDLSKTYSERQLSLEEDEYAYWREVEKVIVNSAFQKEALSWKGNDFSLIKLSKSQYGGERPTRNGGFIAPACLAEKGFLEVDNTVPQSTFMAGFGRREIPYCITDDTGPESYEVCGMDSSCAKNHRATRCSLDFIYNGEKHNKCISSEPSPSSKDADCEKIRELKPELSNITVHLFRSDRSFMTTCYPLFESGNRKGWCSIRRSGVFKNSEPEPGKGWGFCSTDPAQKHCNGNIDIDLIEKSPMSASILNDNYCIEALKDNLRVEQPDVQQEEFDPLLKQRKIYCTGRNHSHSFRNAKFYIHKASGKYVTPKSTSDLKVCNFTAKCLLVCNYININK